MALCVAEKAFINGKIYTLAEPRLAEALLVRDGRIVALGSTEEVLQRASSAEVIDLGDRTVLPGFIDAHTHLVSAGLAATRYLDLSTVRSLEELLEQVRDAVKAKARDEWLIGRGWDESHWPEQRYVTRQDLDHVALEAPVALFRVDGHLLSVNSRALELIELPERLREEADLERGLLREEAAWWFYDRIEPGLEALEEAITAAIAKAHALGITSVHEIVKPCYLQAYQRLHKRGELRLRVYANPRADSLEDLIQLGLETGFGDEWLRLGAVKVFADGSIGARNAALREPYRGGDGRGKLNYTLEGLAQLVQRAHENGWQVMVHAIGDRAISLVLEAYQRAGIGPADRYRIEHFELPNDEDLQEAVRMGIIASMQPNFVKWAGPGGLYEARLGPERTSRISPHRLVLDAGIRLAFGSDCMPLGPLFGLHQAVNAPHSAQRLSVEEAIRCYTQGGAHAVFEEDSKGTLEPGKLADFVALSGDPFAQPEEIERMRVELTVIGGEVVFDRARRPQR